MTECKVCKTIILQTSTYVFYEEKSQCSMITMKLHKDYTHIKNKSSRTTLSGHCLNG